MRTPATSSRPRTAPRDAPRLQQRWPTAIALIAVAAIASSISYTQGPVPPLGSSTQDFGGIRTFLRAPYVTDIASLDADIAVVGVPFDQGTSYRPGARYGPREIREASLVYAWATRKRVLLHRYPPDGAQGEALGRPGRCRCRRERHGAHVAERDQRDQRYSREARLPGRVGRRRLHHVSCSPSIQADVGDGRRFRC